MSLAAQSIRLARYPPETILEARPIQAAANAWTDLVTLRRIPSVNLVKLEYIAQLRAAAITGVRVQGIQAGRRYDWQQPSNALPDLDMNIPLPLYADDQLYVQYLATVLTANYQCRAAYTVKPYTVADKIAMGMGLANLSSKERDLAEKYYVVNKVRTGQLPMPYPRGERLYTGYGGLSANVVAATETTLFDVTPPTGYYAVLRRIWASRPVAPNFTDLTINVYHEEDLWYQIFTHCLPNHPVITQFAYVDLWNVGLKRLRVTLQAAAFAHAGQNVFVEYEYRKLTIWDKLHWEYGDVKLIDDEEWSTDEERDFVKQYDLDNKFKAGIYEPQTLAL